MQKVLGLLLLGGGLAYLVQENAISEAEREEQLAAITRIVARAKIIEPETVPAEHPGLRHPVTSMAAAYPQRGPASSAVEPRIDTAAVLPVIPDAETLPAVSVRTDGLARRNLAPSAEISPNIQRQLARQIQAELKRVGCYSGRLDGSWGERSRSAMATFIARVNASLPTTEPDVILLSLIKGQTNMICGPSCGLGEVASEGRCVARAVVAENTFPVRQAPPVARFEAEQAPIVVAARPDPLPGRMSIGGPLPAAGATPEPVTAWTAPASERLPWQTDTQPLPPSQEFAALAPDETVADPVVTAPAVPRKVIRNKRAGTPPKPAKKRYSSSRSVQQLFLHPLGRM